MKRTDHSAARTRRLDSRWDALLAELGIALTAVTRLERETAQLSWRMRSEATRSAAGGSA